MNILFIGYWGFHDGLTVSTILPHLRILSEASDVNHVVFTTIERDAQVPPFELNVPRVTHVPLFSSQSRNVFVNKTHDFLVFPAQLEDLCKTHKVGKMICRGAPAGALGYLVWKRTGVPFIVESFEPHADYMLESDVWTKWDPRFLLQRYWEEKQKRYAECLAPVAHQYQQKLIREGVDPQRIEVIPCTVDLQTFLVDRRKGKAIREKLGIPNDARVGIYVGKFGGLYWREEAFRIFASCFSHWMNTFHLIILTPDPEGEVLDQCRRADVPLARTTVLRVSHGEVPGYLSAADFAFTFYKTGESKKYLSPIKVGEYWACGLPVLIAEGIGDDTQIVREEGAGVIYSRDATIDFEDLESVLERTSKETIRETALRHRNPNIDIRVYQRFLA